MRRAESRQRGCRRAAAGVFAVLLLLLPAWLLSGCTAVVPRREAAQAAERSAAQDIMQADAAVQKLLMERETDALLPPWIQWHEKELRILPGEGQEGTAKLHQQRFSLYLHRDGAERAAKYDADSGLRLNSGEGDSCIFESEKSWKVSDMQLGDIDGDGQPELLLLVWKRGSFGNHLPFWIEKNDEDYSQHVFIYRFEQGALRSMWMSSASSIPIRDWSLDESGRLSVQQPDGRESCFVWSGFGLKLVEEERTETELAAAGVPRGEMPGRNPLLHAGFREQSSRLTLLAVGDNLIHAGIYRNAFDPETGSYDFSPLYAHVRERIQEYDLAAVNQETIFIEDRSRYSDFPNFASPVEVGSALAGAGFQIVTAANNHSLDQGTEGIEDTLQFWKNHPEVCVLGLHESEEEAGEIRYLRKNGICLALFNYSYGLNGRRLPEGEEWRVDLLSEKQKLLEALAVAEREADLSICFLHIGEEYAPEPTEEQKAWIRELADAGADLILCTHPHVLQPYGRVRTEAGNTAVVFCSLGNFISNQDRPETVLGGAASITITKTWDEMEANAASAAALDVTDAKMQQEKQGRTVVSEYELLPLICHWGKGKTEVYFLSDYTDELAAQHVISRRGEALSLKKLWESFERYREKQELHF